MFKSISMIRTSFFLGIGLALAGCMTTPPGTDLVVNAVGRAVANKMGVNIDPPPAAQSQPVIIQTQAPSATPQPVTVLDFDIPADALKAKDAELALLLRKAGEVAVKYEVPVVLMSNTADRDYLMQQLNQAGEPSIMYRLGEYPRISISITRNAQAKPGDAR